MRIRKLTRVEADVAFEEAARRPEPAARRVAGYGRASRRKRLRSLTRRLLLLDMPTQGAIMDILDHAISKAELRRTVAHCWLAVWFLVDAADGKLDTFSGIQTLLALIFS